jgi:putative ABC transport system substrate-binding protein
VLRSIGLAVLIAVTLLALVGDAQPAGVHRIGFLGAAGPGVDSPDVLAFRHGLRDLGWVEGQTVTIEYRWAEGHPDRLPALARELVGLKVDIIVTAGTVPIRAAKDASATIPIVFVVLQDPVATGLVKSFARPGGNVTGWASQFEELVTKQPQLMKDALPALSRLVLLARVESSREFVGRAEAAARGLGLTVRSLRVAAVEEYENAFKTAQRERAGAVQVLPSPIFGGQRRALIDLAAKYRLPAIYEFRDYVEDGGLMSYGPSITAMFRGAAGYVDRILKGARPGDLPIERPATFELVINLRTAKALGLTISPEILGRADELIK